MLGTHRKSPGFWIGPLDHQSDLLSHIFPWVWKLVFHISRFRGGYNLSTWSLIFLLNPQDLDEKERQLEEQQNRVQSLSNVLAKQQNVWNLVTLDAVWKNFSNVPNSRGIFSLCLDALSVDMSFEILRSWICNAGGFLPSDESQMNMLKSCFDLPSGND